jgi:hypothetical protein
LLAIGDDAPREHRSDAGQRVQLIGRCQIDIDCRFG